jgi:glucose/arabinose dehydrogenase
MAAGRTGMPTSRAVRPRAAAWRAVVAFLSLAPALLPLGGCINQPALLPLAQRKPFDRRSVEFPSGYVLTPLVRGLNCPTALCFDADRDDLLVAESGIDGSEPHIFGYHLSDGSYFSLYPFKRTVSFYPTGFVIYGPVGGMVVHDGRVYVSHRDRDGRGVITAFGYDGTHATIVANLPAQGDYGVTDLVVNKGRLFFGIGTATNSGVVGLDNWDAGWLKHHPDVCDQAYSWDNPPAPLVLNGPRFDTPNPRAGLGQPDIVVTTPFQPFGHSNQSRIRPATIPNGAVCSVALDDGGDVQVLATGLHNPRGLAVDEFDHMYATNDGIQLRGTRPVAGDPDVLINVSANRWYGWPDFTTNGNSVTDPRYAPPISFLVKTGYSELGPLINADASDLHLPKPFDANLAGVFPSLSGAAKLDFVPATGPFARFRGSAVVALDGDRAPYASGGLPLLGFVGGKVDLVDVYGRRVHDFIFNTAGKPASRQDYGTVALERPCDAKFGPDGALYILDFGQMENDSAVPRYHNGTGAIYKLDAVGR